VTKQKLLQRLNQRSGASTKMHKKNHLIALVACLTVCVLSGCDAPGTYQVSKSDEMTRVTSPNGKLDAVLVREDGGGAPGGWDWSVYIVSRGSPVIRPNARAVFEAGTLRNQKIMWEQEHLLGIHYDIAAIDSFRNLWASPELQPNGGTKNDYLVEIQLKPTSDYSLLTPDGDFKRDYE
jgi:hypothetical protein